jgi:hypothetical protein
VECFYITNYYRKRFYYTGLRWGAGILSNATFSITTVSIAMKNATAYLDPAQKYKWILSKVTFNIMALSIAI